MQLRILVSSESASKNGDLRSVLRERLIEYIAREYPGNFPKVRINDPRPAPQQDDGGTNDTARAG
jgi:hypothetical protein